MTPNVPLDTLKELAHVVVNLIDYAQDQIGGSEHGADYEEVQEVLDSASHELVVGLARHIPGMDRDPDAVLSGFNGFVYTQAARTAVRTYEDGTPVVVAVDLGIGRRADYFPRRDGEFEAFKAFFAPRLALVGDAE